MKKVIITFIALVGLVASSWAQTHQEESAEDRAWRLRMHQRDFSKKHLDKQHPISNFVAPPTKSSKGMPSGRVWFPGEWEEVQAIVVTPYYNYRSESGRYYADPLVTGYADYYTSASSQQSVGTGPYVAYMDTTTAIGMVSFYLMDAIQQGGAQAWVRVEQAKDTAQVIRILQNNNLRHNNIRFIIGPGNSIWYRDCGPICFYYGEQDSLAMLDFTYYPGRALDDSLPTLIHQQMGIPNYITRIEWEGGNCLVDGAGMVLSSDAIYANNNDIYGQLKWDGVDPNTIEYTRVTPLSEAQTKKGLQALLGQRATYIVPQYEYDGGTGHIDLYADMWDENGFVFSIMPTHYSSWVDYQTGAANMDSLCSWHSVFDRAYTSTSIPFPSNNTGTYFSSQIDYNRNYTRTYSNHTFVNNLIIQPCFSTVGSDGLPTAAWDRENIEKLKESYPGYTIYCVDVRTFDGSGGAIHCITKQIPAENPLRILHKNITGEVNEMYNEAMPVSAIITNRSGIAHAECNYRINGGEWQTATLTANGNRYYGTMATTDLDSYVSSETTDTMIKVEYYISATSNNGKTITKPMTASQGGYFSFYYTSRISEDALDSSRFNFDTLPVDMEKITFEMATNWIKEDRSHVGIEEVTAKNNFGQFYPNPSKNKANLDINIENGARYDVTIIDEMGRTIHTTHLDAAGQIVYTIDSSKLATGIYHVVFANGNERVVRRLVVR